MAIAQRGQEQLVQHPERKADRMEKLSIANNRLKAARDSHEQDYRALIAELDDKESALKERLRELNETRFDPARANPNASGDDIVEVNAGGIVVAAKRSVLTQLSGTRFEALFSGRWDGVLQRDGRGRIFLDVNPACFQAIVNYLSELATSPEDNPPKSLFAHNDQKVILQQHLGLFGIGTMAKTLESNIIKTSKDANLLHAWLEEDGSGGEFRLLYRSSRDGLSSTSFHSKCDYQGRTITVIETDNGFVLGGYSNTPWSSNNRYSASDKAFLFVLSGGDTSSPHKMNLKNAYDESVVYHGSGYGPHFGSTCELYVNEDNEGGHVNLRNGGNITYENFSAGQSTGSFAIKEMEVFRVSGEYSPEIDVEAKIQASAKTKTFEPVTWFSDDVNKAINEKQESLLQAEGEILNLEDGFKDERNFVDALSGGDTKDVVVLNVSGTIMATRRCSLQAVKDSALARQFDDTVWTEQGYSTHCVKEWTPGDVANWVNNIKGISSDVGKAFQENEINGRELITLSTEGLKCLLLDEMKKLKQASEEITTPIEARPYCFGKILDYLRFKQLHSQGLVEEQPPPHVCKSQKEEFQMLVEYYFPGDSAKLVLG